jgi:hypothetical protein
MKANTRRLGIRARASSARRRLRGRRSHRHAGHCDAKPAAGAGGRGQGVPAGRRPRRLSRPLSEPVAAARRRRPAEAASLGTDLERISVGCGERVQAPRGPRLSPARGRPAPTLRALALGRGPGSTRHHAQGDRPAARRRHVRPATPRSAHRRRSRPWCPRRSESLPIRRAGSKAGMLSCSGTRTAMATWSPCTASACLDSRSYPSRWRWRAPRAEAPSRARVSVSDRGRRGRSFRRGRRGRGPSRAGRCARSQRRAVG